MDNKLIVTYVLDTLISQYYHVYNTLLVAYMYIYHILWLCFYSQYDFYLWGYLTIFFSDFYFNVDSKQNSNTLQCLYFRHQPLVSTKETQILGRTVGSRPDLLCTTSNPRTHRPILIVCQVFLSTKLDFYIFSYFSLIVKLNVWDFKHSVDW